MIETAHPLVGRDRELDVLDQLLGELASVFPALTSKGSYAATADDLIAVVERAGFQRFGIVAQSGGTPYGLALASAAGNRATGIAFVGALGPLRDRDGLADVTGPMRTVFVLAHHAPWLLRPPPSMSRRLAGLLGGAPVTVVAGAGVFALSARCPDALRHAAALPDEGGSPLAAHAASK